MLKGLWWNPLYDGEGFVFSSEEGGWGSGGHGDGSWGNGRVIAYFFTYDSGDQAWYLMDCQRLGETISGKVYRTSGGEMGSNMNPDNVVEAEVGSVTFTVDGDKILFDARIEGRDISYPLQPLFGTGVAPTPEPDPEPDPPPEPDPIPKVVRWDKWSQTLGQWFLDVGGSHGSSNPNEMYGSSPVNIADINPRAKVGEYRLTVLEGSVRIVNPGGSGPYNPEVRGLTNGETLNQGESRVVTLRLGPGSPPPSGWVHANFTADAVIDGQTMRIMTVSSQVADRQ